MSNVTPQIALNKGYTVIAQESITPNSPAQALSAIPGTNAILIIPKTMNQIIYLGTDNCTTDGAPICEIYSYFDGAGPATGYKSLPLPIIETNTPEIFCLYAAGTGAVVNVLYLALNT